MAGSSELMMYLQQDLADHDHLSDGVLAATFYNLNEIEEQFKRIPRKQQNLGLFLKLSIKYDSSCLAHFYA